MYANSNYGRTLFAVATYNKVNNISELISRIHAFLGSKKQSYEFLTFNQMVASSIPTRFTSKLRA